MPTPAERRALLASLLLMALGAAARVKSSLRAPPPPALALAAQLDEQIRRVDSAHSRGAAPLPRPKQGRSRGHAARDTAARARTAHKADALAALKTTPLDIDRATAQELEVLPSVGPGLAARIVAARDACGGLGSLDALDRVPGIGPSILSRIAPLVAFSAHPRDACPGGVTLRTEAKKRRKGR